jgi:hypothetical protein
VQPLRASARPHVDLVPWRTSPVPWGRRVVDPGSAATHRSAWGRPRIPTRDPGVGRQRERDARRQKRGRRSWVVWWDRGCGLSSTSAVRKRARRGVLRVSASRACSTAAGASRAERQ